MRKLRLQLDLSPEARRELDALKEEIGADSDAKVVAHALGLVQWFVKTKKEGFEFIVEQSGVQKKVIFPNPDALDYDWLKSIGIRLTRAHQDE